MVKQVDQYVLVTLDKNLGLVGSLMVVLEQVLVELLNQIVVFLSPIVRMRLLVLELAVALSLREEEE